MRTIIGLLFTICLTGCANHCTKPGTTAKAKVIESDWSLSWCCQQNACWYKPSCNDPLASESNCLGTCHATRADCLTYCLPE